MNKFFARYPNFFLPSQRIYINRYIFFMIPSFIIFFFQKYSQSFIEPFNAEIFSIPDEIDIPEKNNEKMKFKMGCSDTNCPLDPENFDKILEYLQIIGLQIKVDFGTNTELLIKKTKNKNKYYASMPQNNKKAAKNKILQNKISLKEVFYFLEENFNIHLTFKRKLIYTLQIKSKKQNQAEKPSFIFNIENLNIDNFFPNFENLKVHWNKNYDFKHDQYLYILVQKAKNIEFIEYFSNDVSIEYFSGFDSKKDFLDYFEMKQQLSSQESEKFKNLNFRSNLRLNSI